MLAEDIQQRLERHPRVQGVDIHGVGWGSQDMFQYVMDLDDERMTLKGLDRRLVLDAIQLDVNPVNKRGLVELGGDRMYLIGTNEFWNDLAVVVIWGLGTSLLLLLLLMGVGEKEGKKKFNYLWNSD